MSPWHGKFVIGLTGNIATGKSVVRKMLEHAGAFGGDAGAWPPPPIQSDAPGFQPVVDTFGKYILKENGEIDRKKLGLIVFSDPTALRTLESIVHPLVRQAVDHLVRKSKHRVIVIEAIKLLESPLRATCDVIWVVTATEETQVARLSKKRGLKPEEARRRMAAQGPQAEKVAAATTVIENSGSIEGTWGQGERGGERLFPKAAGETGPARLRPPQSSHALGLQVRRAHPRQAADLAKL